jgi:hypothetical protein
VTVIRRPTLVERAERIATYAYKAPDRAALVEYARLEIGSAVIAADADCQGAVEDNEQLRAMLRGAIGFIERNPGAYDVGDWLERARTTVGGQP